MIIKNIQKYNMNNKIYNNNLMINIIDNKVVNQEN